MTRQVVLPIVAFALALSLLALAGCRSRGQNIVEVPTPDIHALGVAQLTPVSDSDCIDGLCDLDIDAAAPPLTSRNELPSDLWPLTLQEAIHVALRDTEILRSLGANVVTNPAAASGSIDPAIGYTDPNFGVEAALAAFDARLTSNLLYARNDDVFNNTILGGGAAEVRDDRTTGNLNLVRTTQAGTQWSFGSQVVHSQTDNTNVLFPHAWTTVFEATARQPLLQGRGTRFNSILGPSATNPGFVNSTGIILSRLNYDISNAQFEANIVSMIREIVSAYWQLSVAQQNFEAIRDSRDASVEIWKITKARYDNDLSGGEADREAQAREQMFELRSRLLAAINGDQQTGQTGVLQAEANLRRLLNFPQSDGRLIVAADQPANVETIFSWSDLASMALDSRLELKQQRIRVQQRTLEREAAQNFLLPRLDAVATYRNNGFGDDLAFGGGGRFASALGDAISNDHGEWEFGLSYDVPIGYRQAQAGVKNAELELQRERAILKEQQRQIMHDLGSAFRQVDQNFTNLNFQTSRLDAAQATVDARTAAYEADAVGFDELLQAQLRLLDSRLSHSQTMTNYEVSKGRLLLEAGQLLGELGLTVYEN